MSGIEVLSSDAFQIEMRGYDIAAASDYYIPFEIPKADTEKARQIHRLKRELIDRLLSIQAYHGDVLVAQYAEIGDPRFYDIENMCIYNLGTSAFSKCCQFDIAFMELPKSDIEALCKEFCLPADKKHFYVYRQVAKENLAKKIAAKRKLAQWEKVYIDADSVNTPKRYWMSLRKQLSKIEVLGTLNDPNKDFFGMAITLHLPKSIYPASIMKPLLDGVVCAFHKSDGADETLKNITGELFAQLVQEAEQTVSLLGEQDYVRPYRKSSIIWNPADERLKLAWISVIQEETQPYFDGKLFEW